MQKHKVLVHSLYMFWDGIDKKQQEYAAFSNKQINLIDKELKIDFLEIENNLEGNTLSRSDISTLLKTGRSIGGKPFLDHVETVNHSEAYDWIKAQNHRDFHTIDLHDILYLHLLVSKGIEINAGRLRSEDIQSMSSQTYFPKPEKIKQLLENLVTWLSMSRQNHPIDVAINAHYRLLLICPFQHRNRRVARLLMNMIIHMHDYPMNLLKADQIEEYKNAISLLEKQGSIEGLDKSLMKHSIEYSLNIRLNILRSLISSDKELVANHLLKIGELAKAINEPNSTIRYWMKSGLLDPTKTLPSGYQLFDQTKLMRAKTIQDLKSQRYRLSEIKSILDSATQNI